MNTARNLISNLTIAISNCSLYSKEHEMVEASADKIFSLINEFQQSRIEIMSIDGDLIVNKNPLRDAGLHGINLTKYFKKKGISRVDFLEGLTTSELKQFITDLSEKDKEISTFSHIKTGKVDVATGIKKPEIEYDSDTPSDFTQDQIERLKELYHEISPFKKLSITGLEEMVTQFVATFKKEGNILKLLSPLKGYSNFTYVHAANVAVLSLFQAELLGVKGKLLHDVGMAALLHDVGKMSVSKEVLDKKGKLDDKEFAEIMLHPSHGAVYLSKMEGITRLAPIVAFEHHRKFDGTGYPKCNANGKPQHICSQIVAISDTYDALRSFRPYKKSWEIKEILALMKKDSGTAFNPNLVDNFARGLVQVIS